MRRLYSLPNFSVNLKLFSKEYEGKERKDYIILALMPNFVPDFTYSFVFDSSFGLTEIDH